MTIAIYILLAIGLYLAIANPYIFIIYYGLIGSDMGAKGITGAIELIFPNYSLIFKCLLFISLIISSYHIYKRRIYFNIIRSWYFLSWGLIISMIIALICNVQLTFSSLLGRILVAICSMGPAVFIIWLAYAPKINHKRLLLFYCIGQCFIAFLIVYQSYIGTSFMEIFNAGLYNDGYFYLDNENSMVALPTNFYQAFWGKGQYFIRCAQFHNANGLGFAAGTLFFLLFATIYKNKYLTKRIIYIMAMALVFLLWCNTGTRGPIIGGILGFVIYQVTKHKNSSSSVIAIFLFLFIFIILNIFLSDSSFYNYFFGSGSSGSFASREELNNNTFAHFFDFFLYGNGGDLEKMVEQHIDPHELPLRIYCMYGIIPAILVTFLTIINPLKLYFKKKSSLDLLSSVCFWISLFVSLTNNLTENVLYWLLLAEYIVIINTKAISKSTEFNSEWILDRK